MSNGWGFEPSLGLHLPTGSVPTQPSREPIDVRKWLRDEMTNILIEAIADKPGHAMAVAAGRSAFRQDFQKVYGAFWEGNRSQADNLADGLWHFLAVQWRERYAPVTATEFLNAVHIPSPLTDKEIEKEIEDGWELEIAGDERAMAENYEGSARVRKGAWLGSKSKG